MSEVPAPHLQPGGALLNGAEVYSLLDRELIFNVELCLP